MHLLALATTIFLLICNGCASPISDSSLDKRQTTSKYCSAESNLCYLQISTTASNPVFRIAIPDGTSAPFEILLQIIAPVSNGWAGFAWGGGMIANPLTVAWPNGNKVTVSSRWSSGRTLPGTYSGATYKTLSSSKNSTHWMAEVVCTGCSKWSGGQLSTTGINTFAWALSRTAVQQPASASSSFSIHNNLGQFSTDLSSAKVSQSVFQQHIKSAATA
ncbi:hypothetical protein B0H66DRAFT_585809 [Apodospora peruviana]|uniref:DOMON domain-containing protein n=1 Tax=Apodospora peruviana TaxID=516989 RepID=A0AAE0IQM3_9PEZI|nr:hypothetical protein B0H66DRAFT_585809 [Apodospora peruviana]